MKIVDVNTNIIGNPYPNPGELNWVFLKLTTDEGVEGWGECNVPRFRELTLAQLVNELSHRFVIGQDPFNIEKIWERLYKSAPDHPYNQFQHPGTISCNVIAAYEMACWDIIGKTLNQPVYRLIGGMRNEKIRHYSYLKGFRAPDPPEKAGEAAIKMVENGDTLFKLDPLPPMCNPQPRDVDLKELRYVDAIFKAIRDAIGDQCDISLGTHGQFTTHSAIKVAKILEKYDALWFEEPIPLENVDEMARLAAHTTVSIAQGERLCTKWEFRQLLDHQAAQIIQLNVGTSGILESKKIAGMAEAYYASVAPWHYSGPISHAASIQLDVTLPNILAQEGNFGSFHSEIVEYPVKIEDGFVIPSDKPGLGFGRVKEELFDEHPYIAVHPRFDGDAGRIRAERFMKALVTTRGILL